MTLSAPKPATFRSPWPPFAAALLLLLCAGCGPAVTLRRMQPAPYNLGPVRKLVLVDADGPTSHETGLVRVKLVEEIDRQGVFQLEDAVPPQRDIIDFFEQLFSKEAAARSQREAEAFRKRNPADVYVRLRVVGVEAHRRHKSKKKKTDDGKEVEEHSYWAEGRCSFQLTLIDGRDGHRLARFTTEREASSPIYDEWRDGLLDTATNDAVSGAVKEALSQFTPGWVTERLELDEKAPGAEAGIELVKKGELKQARTLWEQAAKQSPDSAGLAYNLGCVSEALGDSKAAAEWYEDAMRLDPASERNRKAADALRRRLSDAERLRRRD